MKIGDKVIFNSAPFISLANIEIGSYSAIGIIKDFDGDYIIIETGIGEHYIHKNKVKLLKESEVLK